MVPARTLSTPTPAGYGLWFIEIFCGETQPFPPYTRHQHTTTLSIYHTTKRAFLHDPLAAQKQQQQQQQQEKEDGSTDLPLLGLPEGSHQQQPPRVLWDQVDG